jgi:phage uncharacterized protein (putative large terminase), C-terminal domain
MLGSDSHSRRIAKLKEFFQPETVFQPFVVPSLYDFLKDAWHVLEPATPFVGGWHLEAICRHLEAVSSGDIKRLLINIPPRFCKSTLVSVVWPIWQWLRYPSTRFLCASYALSLSIRDNRKARLLVQSTWFQSIYRSAFTLSADQSVKSYFENTARGYRMSVSTGSAATGHGGDIIIGDDLHAIDEKESDVARESCLDWYDTTLSTRLNNPKTGAIAIVGQRIHMNDISGHLIESGEWVHLCLPAEYEAARKCVTSIGWSDVRKEEGELLWGDRFGSDVLAQQRRNLGALGYSALYQQSPVPPGGYVFNSAHERTFTLSSAGDVYIMQTPTGISLVSVSECYELTTSDVAAKAKQENDYTVFSHWAVTPANDVLLLDVARGHWTIPQQKENARLFYKKHYSQRYRAFYFEDVGYQSAIGQDLLIEGIPCLPFYPDGDKVLRAVGASIYQEAGKCYFRQGAHWLPEWQDEIYSFPKSKHDDMVDTYSMVCLIVRAPGGDIGPLDPDIVESLQNYMGY